MTHKELQTLRARVKRWGMKDQRECYAALHDLLGEVDALRTHLARVKALLPVNSVEAREVDAALR